MFDHHWLLLYPLMCAHTWQAHINGHGNRTEASMLQVKCYFTSNVEDQPISYHQKHVTLASLLQNVYRCSFSNHFDIKSGSLPSSKMADTEKRKTPNFQGTSMKPTPLCSPSSPPSNKLNSILLPPLFLDLAHLYMLSVLFS